MLAVSQTRRKGLSKKRSATYFRKAEDYLLKTLQGHLVLPVLQAVRADKARICLGTFREQISDANRPFVAKTTLSPRRG